jgi:serine/threonine-protein kinase
MSPEQVNADAVDRRTDIFGRGVLLWELLTGRPLFDGAMGLDLVRSIQRCEVPSPSSPRSVPLAAVATKDLARRPGDRFATARHMAEALDEVEGHLPDSIEPYLASLLPDRKRAHDDLLRRLTRVCHAGRRDSDRRRRKRRAPVRPIRAAAMT